MKKTRINFQLEIDLLRQFEEAMEKDSLSASSMSEQIRGLMKEYILKHKGDE